MVLVHSFPLEKQSFQLLPNRCWYLLSMAFVGATNHATESLRNSMTGQQIKMFQCPNLIQSKQTAMRFFGEAIFAPRCSCWKEKQHACIWIPKTNEFKSHVHLYRKATTMGSHSLRFMATSGPFGSASLAISQLPVRKAHEIFCSYLSVLHHNNI